MILLIHARQLPTGHILGHTSPVELGAAVDVENASTLSIWQFQSRCSRRLGYLALG